MRLRPNRGLHTVSRGCATDERSANKGNRRLRMLVLKTVGLFVLTALAEILGCYLPYVWLRKNGSYWLLVPVGLSQMLFAWLLTLHPTAAGRAQLLQLRYLRWREVASDLFNVGRGHLR